MGRQAQWYDILGGILTGGASLASLVGGPNDQQRAQQNQEVDANFQKGAAEARQQQANEAASAAGQGNFTTTVAGGFLGLGSQGYPIYYSPVQNNQTYGADRSSLQDLMGNTQNLGAALSQGVTMDPEQQAQWRAQQMGLAQQLQDQANGIGPSVAGSQLRQSTEMNLQAALAQAASARGGNLGASQYSLAQNRAAIQQQAAMGLAQNRIQEQLAARSQLGGLLDQARIGDQNFAYNQAQLGQQNNQFNAGQYQNANQFANNAYAQQLGALLGLDQQNFQNGVQQAQYNTGLLAQQIAAGHGVGIQSAGQGMQLGGALISGLGTAVGGALGGPAGAAAGGSAGGAVGKAVAGGK